MSSTKWKSSYIDLDILVYGWFCTPCLFGENAYKVDQHSSCPSYAISYSIVALSSQMLGAMMGNFLIPQDPVAMTFYASLCNNFAIGLYAGNMRTKIRNEYSLRGSLDRDTLLHFLCSTCAVCQEAQEIREQTKITEDEHLKYMVIPEPQLMKQ